MLWAVYLTSEGASWERGARWVFFGSLPISHLTPVPSRVCGRGARMCRARETLRVEPKVSAEHSVLHRFKREAD